MSNLDKLREMLADGTFHHATYRNQRTVWEGLYIYRRDPDGMRGFSLVMAFSKYMNDPDLPAAEELVNGTGVSLGAYGAG